MNFPVELLCIVAKHGFFFKPTKENPHESICNLILSYDFLKGLDHSVIDSLIVSKAFVSPTTTQKNMMLWLP